MTTNGRGCRLAGRIRRTLVSALPANVGDAVERIGEMREIAKQEDGTSGELEDDPRLDTLGYKPEKRDSAQHRRMRWVAQISEYWPLERLARLTTDEMHGLLAEQLQNASDSPARGTPEADVRPPKRSRHALRLGAGAEKGRVFLLGSGPGHPGLLTVAAHHILTSPETDLILSDKLVPTSVLALIPESTPLVIAKKFPGNAEGAQSELIALAKDAAQQGKTVVRLKPVSYTHLRAHET